MNVFFDEYMFHHVPPLRAPPWPRLQRLARPRRLGAPWAAQISCVTLCGGNSVIQMLAHGKGAEKHLLLQVCGLQFST